MEIRTKNVADLTTTEYRACYLANYGFNGYMREELRQARINAPSRGGRGGRDGIAILLWDGPEDKTSSLMGWSLLTPVRTWGLVGGTQYTKRVAKYTAQFWVKSQYRRKGFGKILMTEVKKHDPKPHVFPHDNASGELFSSFRVTITEDDKHWMRKKPRVA